MILIDVNVSDGLRMRFALLISGELVRLQFDRTGLARRLQRVAFHSSGATVARTSSECNDSQVLTKSNLRMPSANMQYNAIYINNV